MSELALVRDLVPEVLAAFVGGVLAHRFGQPVILGYLFAGVIIGPFTPGPTADIHSVQVLAEIGVAFLMFSLGAEFSFRELRRIGRVASIGGTAQILITMLLGPLLAPLLGLNLIQGVFLGALQALHGRVTLGILIAQDLAVVPMVVILPALAAGDDRLSVDLALAAAKAAAVLAGAYVFGVRLFPWLLGRAAVTRTRELFLLGTVGLALGTATMTQVAGLSLAFGAFLAGLVVAESEFRTQVLAETLPLRDLFASLFFVSVGMLINPQVLLAQAPLVVLVSLAVLMPDVNAAEQAVRCARTFNDRLDIVARARDAADVERLRRAGATDVVQPEFEAGVEVIRHTFRGYGIGGQELTGLVAGRRAAFYRRSVSEGAA